MAHRGFLVGLLNLVVPKRTPGYAGEEKSFSGKQRNKKNLSIEQKWFADHTPTIERDSN